MARRLAKDYRSVVDWTDANLVDGLEDRAFTFATETDAVGKMIRQTTPDGTVIEPSYDEGGLLRGEAVVHAGSREAAVYVEEISYNERGQREKIVYGNGVVATFRFDRWTFRLGRLQSRRRNGDPLQDWHYTFDPVGNITRIEDRNAPVVFFDNQKITSVATYTYDALYRLIEATGRENDAAREQGDADAWSDAPYRRTIDPGDPLTMRNYRQRYDYDPVGNLLRMRHQAAGNGWSREYAYQEGTNRLIHTRVGANTYAYSHHPRHGYMTSMPHLEDLAWNFQEELARCARQRRCDGGTAETTYYQYDGQGRRIRKVTEHQAGPGSSPVRKDERVCLDGYELYVRHSGESVGLERVSLSLIDEDHRFVIVETRNGVDDGTARQLVRYQLHNHLGSACLELDDSDAPPSSATRSITRTAPRLIRRGTRRSGRPRSATASPAWSGTRRADSGTTGRGTTRHGWDDGFHATRGSAKTSSPGRSRRPSARKREEPTTGAPAIPATLPPTGRHVTTRSVKTTPARPTDRRAVPNARPDPRDRADLAGSRRGMRAEGPESVCLRLAESDRLLRPDRRSGHHPGLVQAPTTTRRRRARRSGGDPVRLCLDRARHRQSGHLDPVHYDPQPSRAFRCVGFQLGGLQSVIGLILGIGSDLLGADVRPHWGRGAEIELPAYISGVRRRRVHTRPNSHRRVWIHRLAARVRAQAPELAPGSLLPVRHRHS